MCPAVSVRLGDPKVCYVSSRVCATGYVYNRSLATCKIVGPNIPGFSLPSD